MSSSCLLSIRGPGGPPPPSSRGFKVGYRGLGIPIQPPQLPQPRRTGTSEPGTGHLCHRAGGTAFLAKEMKDSFVSRSPLASGPHPICPAWAREQCPLHPLATLQSLPPTHPPNNLWLASGSPSLERGECWGIDQAPTPLPRLFGLFGVPDLSENLRNAMDLVSRKEPHACSLLL